MKSRPIGPSIASSRAFALVSPTCIVREIRQSERVGARPAFVAASAYPCQCVLRTRVGTKLKLIGHQPRSPAIASVSDFSETPATAIGGWGCWNGLTWTCLATVASWVGTVYFQECAA